MPEVAPLFSCRASRVPSNPAACLFFLSDFFAPKIDAKGWLKDLLCTNFEPAESTGSGAGVRRKAGISYDSAEAVAGAAGNGRLRSALGANWLSWS
jgi:hypothetical protein